MTGACSLPQGICDVAESQAKSEDEIIAGGTAAATTRMKNVPSLIAALNRRGIWLSSVPLIAANLITGTAPLFPLPSPPGGLIGIIAAGGIGRAMKVEHLAPGCQSGQCLHRVNDLDYSQEQTLSIEFSPVLSDWGHLCARRKAK
jgi:hypothetical protein